MIFVLEAKITTEFLVAREQLRNCYDYFLSLSDTHIFFRGQNAASDQAIGDRGDRGWLPVDCEVR
jgi:hypothetical protein